MLVLMVLALPPQSSSGSQSGESQAAFPSQAARLLHQIAEGLQGHSQRIMLGAFDISRMDGGPVFQGQITAFFDRYDSIRVHFRLVEVKDNVALVDAEMDVSPRDGATPPQRKNMELRFAGAQTPTGWKFIDVKPRNFFS
jgi:hypothetical protein